MVSIWTDTSNIPHFEYLRKNMQNVDVLIIGGGMAGIMCAYMLSKKGINYALVEAESLCHGITKNTTAKITSLHGLIYDKLIREFGVEKARLYLEANEQAVKMYREICSNIDCDFEEKDAFVYSVTDKQKIEKELYALDKIGYKAGFEERLPLPFTVAQAVKFSNQAQFNPLKFVSCISKDLNIFEKTQVKEIKDHQVITNRGIIHADQIIVATHFPFLNKHGSYFLKMYQHRSYVIALEGAKDVRGMYVDESETGLSFRNYENLLLLGGGSHRTGKIGGSYKELTEFANRYYRNATVKYQWATQDCMTLDGVPYIGKYSMNTPGLYVATGFNKWGMTSSMVSGMILSDLVEGRKNPYEEVFQPSRTMLRPQLAVNAYEATANILTLSKKRCPHLGCALKWNKIERTWDCACHGSRFDERGKLIDNPATRDAKLPK